MNETNPAGQQSEPQQPPQQPQQANNTTNPHVGMAIVAYIIFFIPLLTDSKDDPFVKFHTKQGLVLFIAWIACTIVSMVPILGWILAPFLFLFIFILEIIGIINAAQGKQKELPFIGSYSKSFTF